MKYRPEVDGLRALAIAPVILFHAGLPGFSGGYVGVDIFFVISGYLITTILAGELTMGTFSIVNFYERRARRILPALFVVLLVSVVGAYMLLNPNDLKEYAKSLLGAALFFANITAYMQSGYFDAASDIKPIMHLWSLAIEEQYYLFFPLILWAAWRKRIRIVVLTVLLLSCASLWVAEFKKTQDPTIAFFYLHSRAWELGMGAMVALALFPGRASIYAVPQRLVEGLAAIGVGLILFAMVSFDKATNFPGLAALLPTLGAALIMAFASQETFVGRWLGHKALVMVGLLSYSAYLWHQPIFAFARYQSPNELSGPILGGLIALTVVLSYLSWRYVEAPFRQKGRIATCAVAVFSLAGMVLFAAVAIQIYRQDGYPSRYPAHLMSAFDPYKVKEGKFCHYHASEYYAGLELCDFGDALSKQTVLLYGDSHASSMLGNLHDEFKDQGLHGIRVRLLGCSHVVPGMRVEQSQSQDLQLEQTHCEQSLNSLTEMLHDQASAVVVSARWTSKMYPVAGMIDRPVFDNGEGGVELQRGDDHNVAQTQQGEWTTSAEAKSQAIWRFLNRMNSTKKKVLVVYPIPEVGWDLPRYNFATYLQTGDVPSEISTSYALYKKRNAFVIQTLDDANAGPIVRIRPEEFLCQGGDGTRCMAQEKWQPYYYDHNHLASAGAKPIAQAIGRVLATSASPSTLSNRAAQSH